MGSLLRDRGYTLHLKRCVAICRYSLTPGMRNFGMVGGFLENRGDGTHRGEVEQGAGVATLPCVLVLVRYLDST